MQEQSCGCAAAPRRLCDVCEAPASFLACGASCLERHRAACHGAAPADAPSRARQFAAAFNRRFPDSRDRYAPHRRRLMAWVGAEPQGSIAVLGAGNGSDLDLEQLARTFARVHLIDLDGDALERLRERQPAAVRERLLLHGDLDLSGLLDRLDIWGESFPGASELGRAAVSAAQGVVKRLDGSFDVVLSTCVLSQLALPFQRAWVAPVQNWKNLMSALTAVHLATLAGSLKPGGRALLAFDVSSAQQTPELADNVLLQIRAPGLASLVAEPRLLAPWLWDVGPAVQRVHGLEFSRPRP
jgi:hypothetical protein